MKRKLTILLASCLLLAGTTFGQRTFDLEVSPKKLTTKSNDIDFRADDKQVVFSYATGLNFDNVSSIGLRTTTPLVMAMAIDLPKDMYKGFELAGATVHISEDDNGLPNNLKLIVIDAATKKLIVGKEMEAANIKAGLNTIILDEPLTIEEGKNYQVGYVIKKGTQATAFWCSFDEKGPSIPAANLNITIEGSSEPQLWNFDDLSQNKFGSLAIFPLINTTGDTWKDVASTNRLEMDRFPEIGTPPGRLHTRNMGFADITSAIISCQVGDENAVEKSVDLSSTPIKPGYSLPIDVPVTLSETGPTTIKARLISVNGNESNLLPTNTHSGIAIVEKAGGSTTMNSILYERFTTEQCGYCPPADEPEQIAREYFEESGIKVSRIAHHVGFGTDWLTNEDSKPLLSSLKIPGAPSLAINRYVTDEGEYNWHPGNLGICIDVAEESLSHTNAEITKTEQTYDKSSQKLDVKVEGKVYPNIDLDNLFVNIVITESGIKAKSQAGASPGYIHDDVPRIFATGTYGEKPTITDDKISFEVKDIAIPEEYKTDNMKVVVFLSRNLQAAGGIPWNINVYDSETMNLGAGQSTEDVNDQAEVFVTSRNGAIIIEGEYNSALVYDLAGRQVAQTDLAAGIYIVRVETPKGVTVYKVAVR